MVFVLQSDRQVSMPATTQHEDVLLSQLDRNGCKTANTSQTDLTNYKTEAVWEKCRVSRFLCDRSLSEFVTPDLRPLKPAENVDVTAESSYDYNINLSKLLTVLL